jgi:O-antigen ligase
LSPLRALAVAAAIPFLGLVSVLALCQPAALFVAGFFLLAAVRVQPAPVDIVFVLLMLTAAFTRRRSPRLPPSIALALPVFALLTLVSLVDAQSMGHALLFEAITLYLLIAAVWLTSMFADGALTRRAMKAYIYSGVFSALLAVLALHVHFPGASTFLYDPHRAEGLFKDPNVFAPYLVPPAVIVLEELARPRLLDWSARRKFVVFAILTSGIIFAFSRAAWLNFAIAVGTVVIIYAWRRRGFASALKVVLALCLCGAVGFGALAATGSLSFLKARSHEQAYDKNRFASQATGLEDASAHVFGYGPGEVDTHLEVSTHNIFARVAFEQGLPGLVILIVLFASTGFAAIGSAVRDGDVHGIGSAALLGSWLGLVPNSFFIDSLHWRHLWVVAALIWFGWTRAPRDRVTRAATLRNSSSQPA